VAGTSSQSASSSASAWECLYVQTHRTAGTSRTLSSSTIFLAGFELSAEDSEVLHGLMAISTVDVNRERLEFLG